MVKDMYVNGDDTMKKGIFEAFEKNKKKEGG
jgi:hypothetical protein